MVGAHFEVFGSFTNKSVFDMSIGEIDLVLEIIQRGRTEFGPDLSIDQAKECLQIMRLARTMGL